LMHGLFLAVFNTLAGGLVYLASGLAKSDSMNRAIFE
jgi:hypothetical protein